MERGRGKKEEGGCGGQQIKAESEGRRRGAESEVECDYHKEKKEERRNEG